MRKKQAKKLKKLAEVLTKYKPQSKEEIRKVYQRLKNVHKSNKGEL